ncbi:unnamed protein product [Pelagomonas calceolata]|uniref:Cyclic nucleotide-binding domain-containing protein n=1 Tax=Pelagomonas calceolata TaxID=35677 RepID=A0A7S4EAZ1_9STRA|nr:unnamed protein product [Pelagomonas calceolata]
MASAAAILADARKEELEFVRPFHPVLRRPEAAFSKQYRQLDDLQVDVSYTGFKKDDRDFLYKLFAILGDETRKDYISWCPEGRLLIVKKWRVLVSDGHLTAHDIDDTQFMAHLRVYNFRQLDKNQQRRFLPNGDSKWLLFLNPVVNLDQGDGVLKKYIRYCQVHRLKALVEKQSPEAGFIQACRQVLLQTAPKSVASLSNEEIADVLSDGELRIYDKNRCVFREGDPPDGYYICLFGVVSVHKFAGDDDRSKFGRKLVELRDGAGFGEVAFSESCPNRNASVVAVGDEDLATVAETSAPGLSQTICFVASPRAFASVYAERNKLFDTKIALLRRSPLYRHWRVEDLYKLASVMKRRIVQRGDVAKRATSEEVVFVQKGALKIFRTRESGAGEIEVALLGPDDAFGLVEMLGQSGTARRAVAAQTTELFAAPVYICRDLSLANAKTKRELDKIVAARVRWEGVCEEAYRQEKVSITPGMMAYAEYQVNEHGVTLVQNSNKEKRRNAMYEVQSDLQSIVLSTQSLIEESEELMETDLDRAEASCRNAHDLCKETLKKVEVLSRRKRVTDVQRATFRQELQDSLLTSEERLNKIEEVRARQIMAANREKTGTFLTDVDEHTVVTCTSTATPCPTLDSNITRKLRKGIGRKGVEAFAALNEALMNSDTSTIKVEPSMLTDDESDGEESSSEEEEVETTTTVRRRRELGECLVHSRSLHEHPTASDYQSKLDEDLELRMGPYGLPPNGLKRTGIPRKKKRTFFIPGQKGKQPTFGREETPIYAKRPKAKKKPAVVPENPFKRPPKVVAEELPLIRPARKEVAQLLAGHTEHEKKAQAVLARRQKLYEDAISVTSSNC